MMAKQARSETSAADAWLDADPKPGYLLTAKRFPPLRLKNMTDTIRHGFILVILLLADTLVRADTISLFEEVKPGDLWRYQIHLDVRGKMIVQREGKNEALPIQATGEHEFVERVHAPDASGGIGMVLRHYLRARSQSESAGEKMIRELAENRRLIVAKRSTQGTLHFSPNGPLTQEELELVAEHFDTLCLPAILPNRELREGETWAVPAAVVQHACLFEGLIKHDLVGKLEKVSPEIAEFSLQGTAEGIEYGAHAKLTITARGEYSRKTGRITRLTWEQVDNRQQGPASPATEMKARVIVTRTPLEQEPKELAAEVRTTIPSQEKDFPLAWTQLRYSDRPGRYEIIYGRNWHIVGRTRDHLVMRLIERGEFVGQATITRWKKADPGQHTNPADFKQVLNQLPNWRPEQILAEGTVPTDPGRWLYRLTVRGQQDGLPVIQSFYLLAGPQGDQVTVTVIIPQDQAARLNTQDLELVNAITFPARVP